MITLSKYEISNDKSKEMVKNWVNHIVKKVRVQS